MHVSQVNALFQKAIALDIGGRLAEALAGYDAVVALAPDHADALSNRANLLADLGRTSEALAGYDRALAVAPGHADAWSNRGNLLLRLGDQEQALACYDRAIAIAPDHADAHLNRANLLGALERFEAALTSRERLARLDPRNPDMAIAHGTTLAALRRFAEALDCFDRAVALAPGLAQAHYNRGHALSDLRRVEEALVAYDRALALAPDYADAWNNRGVMLRDLRRLEEAVASLDRALALRPDNADALYNRGNARADLGRSREALADFDAALRLKPDDARIHNNRGNVLVHLKRPEEAVGAYARAFTLSPDHPNLRGMYLHTRMHLCDWSGFDAAVAELAAAIDAGRRASMPFPVLALCDSPEIHRACAATFVAANSMADPDAPNTRHPRHQRIRIGYFSADFHSHATMHLMAELFERHDRKRFQIFAFSFGPDRDDPWRTRLRRSVDRFIEVRDKTDRDVARMARRLEIDIAVDLKGFTEDGRNGIFRSRAAPIQVNYLGYPGTMAMPEMDYILADPVLIPPESRAFYSEALALLPDSYQPNCATRAIAQRPLTRQDLGLPASGTVFCCFNNNYKITPEVFDGWMRILGAVAGSVLWLLVPNQIARANLRREALARGIDPTRLVFAAALPIEDHLNRLRHADLFLDTFPYTAHTTASDALRMGLPLLTRAGSSFASRVAASLLSAVGLEELICTSPKDYEALAIALAGDPARLARLRTMLATATTNGPLFDAHRFTRNVEAIYQRLYDHWRK